MRDYSERLNARVRAYNRVNKRAKELHPELVEIFRPFVGKKVLTQLGFVAKLAPKIEAIREREGHSHEGGFQFYSYGQRYSLVFTLKAWEPYNGGDGGEYAEASIYVGDLAARTLTSLRETPPELRTDYNADEVRRLRKEAEVARDAAREAQSALYPFGRFDQ